MAPCMVGINPRHLTMSPQRLPASRWDVHRESRFETCDGTQIARVLSWSYLNRRPSIHLTQAYRDPHRDESRGGFGKDETDVFDANFDLPSYSVEDVKTPVYLSGFPGVLTELVEYYRAVFRMYSGVGLLLEQLKTRRLD
jgi:hypothetical protein